MRKKDILELKKRLKKDHCTFTKMCGCYVNGEKHILFNFKETFLNLEDDEYFKYLEIAKKIFSGTIGNNLLELNFPLNEDLVNEKQISLMQLKKSTLKDDSLLDNFYKSVVENYDYTGNYLILVFHDAYDVITKTKDNLKLDESDEVYEYILCAICPVSLSKPGLRCFEEENKVKARIRDWVVELPTSGFAFPAFIDRGADVNAVMYYTKNPKEPHPELMENVLGCTSKQTATIQKETFKDIVKDTMGADEEKADKIFMDIQETLNYKIEEHNSIYDDTEEEPMTLTDKNIKEVLGDSGLPEEITNKIEKSYIENFSDEPPLAENLVDIKLIKINEQRKKEERLEQQVEVLQEKLEQAKQEIALGMEDSNQSSEDDSSDIESDASNYDVVLHVKPEKISQIKSQIIDGQKCIVIPLSEDEQATVNGQDDLI